MLQILRGNKKGFTLIELMIVIAIIGILAAIAIPNFISYRDKAFCGQAEHDAQNTLAALSAYFSEPDRTTVPAGAAGIAQLKSLESLSLNNADSHVSLVEAAGGSTITVTVTDGSTRCPRGTSYAATLGGAEGSWQ
jgi:prepilin-type N-terminal cleavage/methylation domain-containing protein